MLTSKSHHASDQGKAPGQCTSAVRNTALPDHLLNQITELSEWYSPRQLRKMYWKMMQIAVNGASDEIGMVSASIVTDWMFTHLQVIELLSDLLDHYGHSEIIEEE
jgi:hypothetical protein